MTASDAAYLRISDDPEGTALGVERQLEDVQHLVKTHGRPPISDEYIFRDNDRGASARSRKRREAWDDLLERIRSGEVGRVYAYSNSRLTRRLAELEVLIQLTEKTGVAFFTVIGGQDDLSTSDGRMVARIKASVDAAEAERVSERLTRKHRQSAETGKVVGGTRLFGWRVDDRLTLDPIEAPAGRRVIDGFLAGQSLRSLVIGLQDAGLTTTRGGTWTDDALRKWLVNPRLCGYRELAGELVRDAAGDPIVGEWEPIATPQEWSTIRSVFDRRKKGAAGGPGVGLGPAPARRRYLLSGLARCGKCLALVRVDPRAHQPSHAYVCPSRTQGGCGGVGRRGDVLDAYVIEAVLTRAEEVDLAPAERAWPGEADLDRLLAKRSDWTAGWKADRVSSEVYFEELPAFEAQIKEARRERDQWSERRLAAARLPADLRAEWEARGDDLDWKRSVVFRHLHSVVIQPVGGGRRPFDPTAVELVWRA